MPTYDSIIISQTRRDKQTLCRASRWRWSEARVHGTLSSRPPVGGVWQPGARAAAVVRPQTPGGRGVSSSKVGRLVAQHAHSVYQFGMSVQKRLCPADTRRHAGEGSPPPLRVKLVGHVSGCGAAETLSERR